MKAILIEDESSARNLIKGILKSQFSSIELIGEADNGIQGLELIQTLHPDLVFMDIELPGLFGFQILERIEKIDFAVVFITAFNQYAIRAFEFSAIDYILKPVTSENLAKAIIRAQERQRLQVVQEQYELLLEVVKQKNPQSSLQQRVSFSTNKGISFVVLKDIIRIEAENNCCSIYVKGLPNRIFMTKNIGAYEEMFEDYFFMFRVSRGHIVNLYHVILFSREDGGMLSLPNHNNDKTVMIPVNKSHELRQELFERMKRLGK